MARQKKVKAGESGRSGGEAGGVLRAILIHFSIGAVMAAGAGYGYYRLKGDVERRLAFAPEPPAVVLKSRPAWMSDALADQIAESARPRGAHSAMDHQLLQDVAAVLERNAWVREVRQVRRIYGEWAGEKLEIDCEYRAPMALVSNRGEYILVDGEGYRLPERFVAGENPRIMFGPDGRVNIRIIEGVGALPPFQSGRKWVGEDLQAGLDLVKLLYNRPFAEDIYRVNVANFRGRRSARDAQLTLVTRYGTEIRWGEPVKMSFYSELRPAEKLHRLARLREEYGRVDGGHAWLDIRLDKITYPAETTPVVQRR